MAIKRSLCDITRYTAPLKLINFDDVGLILGYSFSIITNFVPRAFFSSKGKALGTRLDNYPGSPQNSSFSLVSTHLFLKKWRNVRVVFLERALVILAILYYKSVKKQHFLLTRVNIVDIHAKSSSMSCLTFH